MNMKFEHAPGGAMAIHAKVQNQLVFKADGTLESATKPDLKTASPETLATVGAVREMNRMPLFFQGIHNGTREGLQRVYKGCATPNDAIQISALTHPELVKAVLRGDVATCDEAAFQADPYKRGMWSRGTAYLDGAGKPQGWVRTPDLNQAMPDSLPPPFARGGADAKVGSTGKDTMRNVVGTAFQNSYASTGTVVETGAISGPFYAQLTTTKTLNLATISATTGPDVAPYRVGFDISKALPAGHTGTEFAPWHVYGVSYSITSNGVFNEGAIDAEQVMGEVLALQSKIGIAGQAKDLRCWATGTNALVSVTVDQIFLDSAGGQTIKLRGVDLTINTAAVGVNGLDTGALAANTWYSKWVISDGVNVRGLISLSATAPTLPVGYTHKARVGWIRTDASANKYPVPFTQAGTRVQLQKNVALASGLAGSISVPTFVPVSITAVVPVTAVAAGIGLTSGGSNSNSGCMAHPNNKAGTPVSTTNPPQISTSSASTTPVWANPTVLMLLESTNIFWASGIASGAVYCFGWEDSL